MKLIMTMPERFKIVRESLKYSQKEMAAVIGVSLAALQGYEAGRSVPGGSVFESLVTLGFNANWLLTGEGEMKCGEGADRIAGAVKTIDHGGAELRSADDVIDMIDQVINKKIAMYGDLEGIRGFAMATIVYKVFSSRFIGSPEYRMESLETIVDCLFKLATGKTTADAMKNGK